MPPKIIAPPLIATAATWPPGINATSTKAAPNPAPIYVAAV